MKVADLIASSVWMPNVRADQTATPAVSILMPTYCRGRDGLFQRAVRSLRDQALQDFELIIVDDGSTDGTFDEIQRIMADDPRVHCVRHPVNVGLPAVSMFQAYARARADYIAFAFDDDVATHDGLARLLEYAVAHDSPCVHGYATYRYGGSGSDGTTFHLGRRDAAGRYPIPDAWLPPAGYEGSDARCLWKLHSLNLIGNMSVVVHRRVIEAVGLYDPHVIMVRSCDGDLWKRIAARFAIDYCDVHTSIENGDQRSDALKELYRLDVDRVVEYASVPRDERLRPSRFPEFDVWATPDGADARLAAYAERVREQMRRRGRPRPMTEAPLAEKKVLLLYDQGSVTHLLLHALPEELARRFRVHHGRTDWDALWPVLTNTSAVIVCADAERFARLSIAAEMQALEIPFYFYPADRAVPANIAALLPPLRGLVAATPRHVSEAHALGFDADTIHWPLSADPATIDDARMSVAIDGATVVGLVGGEHEVGSVLNSLRAIDGRVRLRVVARSTAVGGDLDVVPVSEDRGWPQIIAKWRRHGVQLLLIAPGASTETGFDGDAAVLMACLIGAVPVVLDPSTSPSAADPHPVLRIGDARDVEPIAIALRDHDRRAAAFERALDYCRTTMAAEPAAAAARQLLDRVPAVDVLLAEDRWRRLERLRTRTIVAQHEQIQQWQHRCRDLERTIDDLKRGGADPAR